MVELFHAIVLPWLARVYHSCCNYSGRKKISPHNVRRKIFLMVHMGIINGGVLTEGGTVNTTNIILGPEGMHTILMCIDTALKQK